MPTTFPALYRRRFIPFETILLKDDIILDFQEDYIITRWNTLKPRHDMFGGISAYFIKEGFKISKIFDCAGNLTYWYCDMIRTIRNPAENSIYFEDLLIDIVLFPDGKVRVMDTGELADAYQAGLIDAEMLCSSLHTADRLLSMIENGSFDRYKNLIVSIHTR